MTVRSLPAPFRHGGKIARLVASVMLALMLSMPGWAKPPSDDPPAPETPPPWIGVGKPASDRQIVESTLEKGDTLSGLLGRESLQIVNKAAVLRALDQVHDPRRLRPGDGIRLVLEPQESGTPVRSLHIETEKAEDLTVGIVGGAGPPTRQGSTPALLEAHRATGIVGPNFRATLLRAALPKNLVGDILAALRYDPDMPSPPPAGARFSILYETAARDPRAADGELKLVALDDGHKVHRIYRYHTEDGSTAYMRDDGHGVALVRLGKPIRVEIVTSPYGWRIHPVFGDRRFHKGVDYGAPLGTPVVVAADGKVDDVGWRGNYGRYVRLDHGAGLATAYAHLSRFAEGLAAGEHVREGQVIGYVGETGIATGPHLYYEVVLNGEHVDPLNVPGVVALHLEGSSLAGFLQYARALRQEAARL